MISQLHPGAQQLHGIHRAPHGVLCAISRPVHSETGVPRHKILLLTPFKSATPGQRGQKCTTRALFNFARKAPQKVARGTVIPEPSYNIPLVLAGITALSAYEGNPVLAGLTGILGAFLALQASRVRFIFRDDSLEVVLGEAQEETENAFVGGENKWAFQAFTNWEYWWPGFPVLVYFKETQTKPEGQIHFFPIIFNGKQLYDVMVERCGGTQKSGPK